MEKELDMSFVTIVLIVLRNDTSKVITGQKASTLEDLAPPKILQFNLAKINIAIEKFSEECIHN